MLLVFINKYLYIKQLFLFLNQIEGFYGYHERNGSRAAYESYRRKHNEKITFVVKWADANAALVRQRLKQMLDKVDSLLDQAASDKHISICKLSTFSDMKDFAARSCLDAWIPEGCHQLELVLSENANHS